MYSFNCEIQQEFSVLSSKESNKRSKANGMFLTFAFLAENSWNKTMAFKSFLSYFGSERFGLVMRNYMNTSDFLNKKKMKQNNTKIQPETYYLIA